MLRIISRRFSSVVPPPFLYGHRHPLIAGLIRFDDEISEEARRVLQTSVFSENKFFSKINPHAVKLVEIVSDETVSKSHDRTLIEAGTGTMIKTAIKFPGRSDHIPCGISLGFRGVGISNDAKLYHANQVRTFTNEFVTENISDGGFVVTCHEISEDENVIDLLPGHEIVGEVLEVFLRGGAKIPDNSEYKIVELTGDDFEQIYDPCVRFNSQIDNLRFLGLCADNGTLICGGSVTSENILVDPFVTLGCKEGEEKLMLEIFAKNLLGTKKIVFSSSDKFIANLFPEKNVRYVVSAKPVGDEISDEIFSLLKRRPWVLRGLLV